MTDERSWWDYEQSVRGEVREHAGELMADAYPDDTLHELVDGSCPMYTSEILWLAADNIDLAVMAPENGPGFDGTPTPVNIIVANIYEALMVVAREEWEEVKSAAWYCQEADEWMFDDECGHNDCDGEE